MNERVVSGVYVIRCKTTNKVYVGSSSNVFLRWKQHKSALRNGKHHSAKLQNAWNKYGEDSFEFELVEEVIDGILTVSEQVYINNLDSHKEGYNVSAVAYNASFLQGVPSISCRHVSDYPRGENPDSLANLLDNSAPDKPGETVPTTIRLTPEQREWLDTRTESRSYHVRQALQSYINSFDSSTPKRARELP